MNTKNYRMLPPFGKVKEGHCKQCMESRTSHNVSFLPTPTGTLLSMFVRHTTIEFSQKITEDITVHTAYETRLGKSKQF